MRDFLLRLLLAFACLAHIARMAEISADKIAENAAAPKRMQTAAGSAEQHSIQDQIAADKYARANAANTNPAKALRRATVVPPGTV